jgi:hypothetical protein
MPPPEQSSLILLRLDETRQEIEVLLSKIDPGKPIYPGWTIKDVLAHMTGWDDVTIASLRAHIGGRLPSQEAIRSLNDYNTRTVASRQDLDYELVLKEWRLTRQVLRTIIEQMPEDKFIEPLHVPWGGKTTVTELVDMFRGHEQEHARDIRTWMANPNKPLGKEGN